MVKIIVLMTGILGIMAFHPAPAAAYVGPGAGITMLSALWAIIATICLALVGVLLWPLRSLLRWFKRRRQAAGGEAEK